MFFRLLSIDSGRNTSSGYGLRCVELNSPGEHSCLMFRIEIQANSLLYIPAYFAKQ